IGFNITFFPQHNLGLLVMPRRVYTYPGGIAWDFYNLLSTTGAFMIAFSVLLFIINFFRHFSAGEPAGANPWGADSLEWATESPPANYGFAVLPIVRSRAPLWEQSELREGERQGDPRVKKLVEALGKWPTSWRAALVTSMIDGKPQEIFRVSGPSIWPFIGSVGMVTIFGAEIFAVRWLVLVGIAVLIVAIVGWHWPDPAPTTEEEERAFEQEYGVAVRTKGSQAVARGGMVLTIIVLAVALATLLFSYFYIRLQNPIWPPDNIPLPGLVNPAIALVLLALGSLATAWAKRQLNRDAVGSMRLGVFIAFLLSAGALAFIIADYVLIEYSWQINAYGSLVWVIGAYLMVVMILGLGMNVFIQIFAARGEYSARRNAALDNLNMYWIWLVVAWLLGFGVLYLAPHLT
ncbi:MAG TPA: hypothetical protein VLS48_03980, partial [Anaerolineales bacterium]|nr:hypothetical protein [Anaerolineales bacterium]